ncbi:ATPase PAAT isoform X4 [Eptesicus fuscus]|uniref:ATPase PAAT isoform X4 n=1 Tax=Eptesicus fuscus TaxID=29078 RepID=UPI0024048A9E|nr:ATPase PAAT isoform X4 [Eptesicus fuscus]
METETEDERSATHPTLASSWDAACGALGRSLRVRRAQDSDWDELLAPPSSGRDLVSLKRSRKSPDEEPCFLSLSCGPSGGEEVVSVGILSSARNMEVYLGEEYCGTSRGRRVGNVLDSSEHGKIILYKKFLKLESAAQACKIKRCIPLGEQLQAVLGSAACKRVLGLRASAPSGACDGPTCAPAPLRAGLTSGRGTEDVKAPRDESSRPPGGGHPAPLGGWDIAPQSHPLPGRDLQLAASFLPKRASDSPGAPAPELLPILQDVCGQVRRLRGPQSAAWPGHVPAPSEGGVGAGMGEPPACSYLEKILSKKLELMERRLTDHLDERLRALQEHIDGKVALLARSLQSPGSPPPGLPLTRCDSGDGLSNGER